MFKTRLSQTPLTGLAVMGLHLLVTSSAVAAPPQISAGSNSTCTIATDGSLKCWGDNSSGQLAIGNFVPFPTPRPVTFFTAVTALSVGNGFACAISSGALYCWGKNDFGQLGNGTTTRSNVPSPVTGLGSGVTAVTAGGSHTCAIHNQRLKCWGNNSHGQLGLGPTVGGIDPQTTPQQVNSEIFLSTTMISAGDQHTCATAFPKGFSRLYCWGFNGAHQAGQPNETRDLVSPTLVESPKNFVPFGVAAGYLHTCGAYRKGPESRVFCWGSNEFGQLGLGFRVQCQSCYKPITPVIDDTAVVVTGPTSSYTCSLSNHGKMHCWGYNRFGQIGDNSTTDRYNATIPLHMGSRVMQISVGGDHTCSWVTSSTAAVGTRSLGVLDRGLALDIHPYCWGKNTDGQLGVRDFSKHLSATRVFGL